MLTSGSPSSESIGAIRAIVGLLLATPEDMITREAKRLDAALCMLCMRLSGSERAEAAAQLKPLASLFTTSMEMLSTGGIISRHDPVPTELRSIDSVDPEKLRFAAANELMDVARLPSLGESATAILVFRGDSEVLATVTGNPGARFAVSSFMTLIELAPSDRRIKENLSLRTDLPERLALRLLPYLNRRQLMRMLVAGAEIDTATAASDLAAERDVYCGSGVDPSRPLDDTITMLCADARVSELSELLADRLSIALASSMNLLCGRLDHAAGLILRAAGASSKVVQAVLNLRQRLECRHSKDQRAAHEAFTRYDLNEARELVAACAAEMKQSGLVIGDFDFEGSLSAAR